VVAITTAQEPEQSERGTSDAQAPSSSQAKQFRELTARIDAQIDGNLQEEKIPGSVPAEDAEFLRRVSLDLTGVIPTAERAKAFLDSKERDKRAKLIDELLASADYGKHMADLWSELLLGQNTSNRRMHPEVFIQWLDDSFAANKPWDRMARELLTAEGAQEKNPAVTYFLANESADRITDNVTRNLLGVQLQCAQCHNHPFTGWKQTEYWGMAAFFMKLKSDDVNKAALAKKSPAVYEGVQVNKSRRALPESAMFVQARFLQGEAPEPAYRQPYRPVLASWIVAEKNPFFAKAMVNRLWAQCFGRGLVNPVDDMNDNNTPSHPQLLDQLAAGFVAGKYDVKGLLRTIVSSKAYQRSSKPVKGNEKAEPQLYARMGIKMMSAEMLYDSLAHLSGPRPDNGERVNFARAFRLDEGGDPTEYSHGIPQALRLMNSSQFNRTQYLDQVIKNNSKPEEVLEELYLATLSRRPTSREMTRLLAHVKKGEARHTYSDVLWALVNSSEFVLDR
jgi:hypothetical protein